SLLQPHPDDREELLAKQKASFTSGEDFLHTCRFLLPDKGVRWLRAFSRGVRLGGKVVYNGMLQDVTDEVEATRKLQVEHSKVEALLEASGEAVLLVDQHLRIRRTNRKADEMFARAQSQLQGAYLPDLIEEPEAKLRAAGLLTSGGMIRLTGRHGTPVVADVRISSVCEHGETLVVLSLRDLTDRFAFEQREKELIQRFESATAAAGIGVWEWNIETGALSWSAQMYELYGIPMESACGTYEDWKKALHPEDAERAQNELADAVAEGKPFDTKFRIIRPDGQVRVIKTIAILNADGGYDSKVTGVNFDITEQVELEARERELICRFETATGSAKIGVWEFDLNTQELNWSDQMFDIFDVDPNEFTGKLSDWAKTVHPEDASVTRAHLQECVEQGKPFQATFRVIRKDGEIRYITAVADLRKQGKDNRRITGINYDVTDEKLQTERLHLQERCLEVAANGIVIADKKGHIIWANAAFSTLTGYSQAEVLGKNPRFLRSGFHDSRFYRDLWKTIRTGRTWHGELINRRKNGSIYVEDMTISPVRNATGKVSHFIAIKQDISTRKLAEKRVRQQGEEIQLHLKLAEQRRYELENLNQRLRYIAERDSLTGLMSRRMFQEVLEQDIKSLPVDQSQRLALFFVDLDNFKLINDTMGHGAGDAILKIAGKRLAAVAEDLGAEAARLGGDEFTLLLKNNPSDEAIRHLAERVLTALQQPFALWDRELIVTGSVGITYESDPQASAQDMLSRADTAMYRAKSAGKSQSAAFEPWMNEEAKYRLEVENELRYALSREELFIQYQPLVNLETRLPLGVEALVRWQHPVRGFVSPGDFIPLAEEVGLIGQIGEWVLRESCQFWRRSVDKGFVTEDFVVSVNVSVKQLVDPGFIGTVQEAIEETGIRPASLKLEVTETSIMHSVDAVQDALFALRDLGAQIAMDDFGTGYSSMGSLVKLPVDTVKIDKSFVDEIGHDLRATAIMRALVTLCSTLNLEVIGEGIETEDQLIQLNALGCRIGQGYFLGKPMLEERLLEYLQRNAA
ncbi:MAG: EAL domain-containing protein, partial [Fimbriimonadaceae bacterium]